MGPLAGTVTVAGADALVVVAASVDVPSGVCGVTAVATVVSGLPPDPPFAATTATMIAITIAAATAPIASRRRRRRTASDAVPSRTAGARTSPAGRARSGC